MICSTEQAYLTNLELKSEALMPTPDYYKILGVHPEASHAEINRAFRRLSQQYHPDHGGSEQRFKQISEAHAVLGKIERRKEYDSQRQAVPPPQQPAADPDLADEFDDLWEAADTGSPPPPRHTPPPKPPPSPPRQPPKPPPPPGGGQAPRPTPSSVSSQQPAAPPPKAEPSPLGILGRIVGILVAAIPFFAAAWVAASVVLFIPMFWVSNWLGLWGDNSDHPDAGLGQMLEAWSLATVKAGAIVATIATLVFVTVASGAASD